MHDTARAAIPNQQYGLLNTDEAAAILGVTPRTLEVWRCTKRHQIPFLKIGRLIRYRRSDLERWLASRLIGAPE